MNIELLSTQYNVRKILNNGILDVLSLCEGNPIFYQYCPPSASIKGIEEDITALPPHKTYEDKFYIVFYKDNGLVAVMDLISRYPDDETAFIGFFMIKKSYKAAD